LNLHQNFLTFSGNLNLHQNQTKHSLIIPSQHTHDDDDVLGTHLGRGIHTYLEAKVEQQSCSMESGVVFVTHAGLVLKTDTQTEKRQVVSIRTSGGGDDPNNKPKTSRRNSNNSVRISGELSEDGKERGNIPRVSKRDQKSQF
jgi:hypothetical protein